MIRDQEISRLVSYLNGMGIKVIFSNVKSPDVAAACAIDGSEIIIYKQQNKTKTETILSLLHESGHALNHIRTQERVIDKKLDKVLEKENLNKKQRKIIYNEEVQAVKWWDEIARDTIIKIPQWRIDMQKELDLMPYEYYYKTGKFPTTKYKNQKTKEIKQKWKK